MDYERRVFPFLYTLTSLHADKLPPARLLPLLLHYNSKPFNCLLAEMCRDTFFGGVSCQLDQLLLLTYTDSKSILLIIEQGHRTDRGHFYSSMANF